MASAGFPEAVIIAELYAQVLEANGYTANRDKLNLGPREALDAAFQSGQIDMEPEYLGSYLAFLNPTANVDPTLDDAAKATFEAQAIKALLPPKDLSLLDYADAKDANTFVVTSDFIKRMGERTPPVVVKKISDLAPIAGEVSLGGPPECPLRPYCQLGLKQVYGLDFKGFKPYDTGGPFTVAALVNDEIQVGLAFTTDPQIGALNLVELEDDKHLQPSENIAPVIRTAMLNQAPEITAIIKSVSNMLKTDDLVNLRFQREGQRKDAKAVATAWLKGNGLIK